MSTKKTESTRRTDDIVEIQQLLARYAVTITQGDVDGLIGQFYVDHHALNLAAVGKNGVRRTICDLLRDGSEHGASKVGMAVPTDGNRIRPDLIRDSDQRFCHLAGSNQTRRAREAFGGRLGQCDGQAALGGVGQKRDRFRAKAFGVHVSD